MNIKRYISVIAGLAIVGSLALAFTAFAAAPTTGTPATMQWANGQHRGGMMMRGQMPAVIGTVTAVSGNTITVSGRAGFGGFMRGPKPATGTAPTTSPTPPALTTFTVDATNATVTKANAASTVANIAVGDMVAVQGTVSGTSVTATTIRDGQFGKGGMGMGTPPVSPITGNGQPVVAGKVVSISGNTITITNSSNVTYTIDALSAKVVQGQNTIAVSNLNTGDSLVVQGTVNGTSVVASSVIDQTRPAGAPAHPGFFGSIGKFFSHIFGF